MKAVSYWQSTWLFMQYSFRKERYSSHCVLKASHEHKHCFTSRGRHPSISWTGGFMDPRIKLNSVVVSTIIYIFLPEHESLDHSSFQLCITLICTAQLSFQIHASVCAALMWVPCLTPCHWSPFSSLAPVASSGSSGEPTHAGFHLQQCSSHKAEYWGQPHSTAKFHKIPQITVTELFHTGSTPILTIAYLPLPFANTIFGLHP